MLLQTTPSQYYHDARASSSYAGCATVEPAELSLFSTVVLVLLLAVAGAFFIMTIACFLGEDHHTGE